jgi:hypothetical protein
MFVGVRAKLTPDLAPQTAENHIGTLTDTREVVPESREARRSFKFGI